MASNNLVADVHALVEKIQAKKIDDLMRNPDWGTISFEKARPSLEGRVWPICNDIADLPIQLLPDQDLNKFKPPLTELAQTIKEIIDFSLSHSNPSGIRDDLVNRLEQNAESLFRATHTWIPYLAFRRGDIDKNIGLLNKAVSDAQAVEIGFKENVDKKREEIEKILLDVREMAGEAGVAQFTNRFSQEALKKGDEARNWLISASIGGLCSLLLSGAIFVGLLSPDLSDVTADTRDIILVQSMTTKFILLGILLTTTLWCGRQYNILKHLQTQNQHRADSLKTFQAFTQAANEPAGRDAVLIEATRAIFSHSPSGYIKGSGGDGDNHLTILEVLKQVTNPKAD